MKAWWTGKSSIRTKYIRGVWVHACVRVWYRFNYMSRSDYSIVKHCPLLSDSIFYYCTVLDLDQKDFKVSTIYVHVTKSEQRRNIQNTSLLENNCEQRDYVWISGSPSVSVRWQQIKPCLLSTWKFTLHTVVQEVKPLQEEERKETSLTHHLCFNNRYFLLSNTVDSTMVQNQNHFS